jgi:phenylalanyl-tRNA synthetase alpha chain
VDSTDDIEMLGDRVRDALGPDAATVEEVAVLSETPYRDLPPAAISRLGMSPTQKNMLIRVVLRPLERTLTDVEANQLRDRIYTVLHQGTRHQWATRPEGTGGGG